MRTRTKNALYLADEESKNFNALTEELLKKYKDQIPNLETRKKDFVACRAEVEDAMIRYEEITKSPYFFENNKNKDLEAVYNATEEARQKMSESFSKLMNDAKNTLQGAIPPTKKLLENTVMQANDYKRLTNNLKNSLVGKEEGIQAEYFKTFDEDFKRTNDVFEQYNNQLVEYVKLFQKDQLQKTVKEVDANFLTKKSDLPQNLEKLGREKFEAYASALTQQKKALTDVCNILLNNVPNTCREVKARADKLGQKVEKLLISKNQSSPAKPAVDSGEQQLTRKGNLDPAKLAELRKNREQYFKKPTPEKPKTEAVSPKQPDFKKGTVQSSQERSGMKIGKNREPAQTSPPINKTASEKRPPIEPNAQISPVKISEQRQNSEQYFKYPNPMKAKQGGEQPSHRERSRVIMGNERQKHLDAASKAVKEEITESANSTPKPPRPR